MEIVLNPVTEGVAWIRKFGEEEPLEKFQRGKAK